LALVFVALAAGSKAFKLFFFPYFCLLSHKLFISFNILMEMGISQVEKKLISFKLQSKRSYSYPL
jgi:type III secretory pathway component EscR